MESKEIMQKAINTYGVENQMKIKAGQEENYNQFVTVNSKDPYSNAVVRYAERWANLMESRIASGG